MPTLKSWISPKTQKGLPSKIHGLGFFAKAPIKKGELIAVKAGHIIDRQTLLANLEVINDSQMQIADDLYIAPLTHEEMLGSMIYFNHSCEPNAGIGGQIALIAMRNIAEGEEISFDYATLFNNDIMKFECSCQTPSCRHHITGRDWQIPKLQAKYRGYFAWFIEQKIKAS